MTGTEKGRRPLTVNGKVLLGWMPRDEAIKCLTKACVFDTELTEDQAVRLWGEYRQKVLALPPRSYAIPEMHRMTLSERREVGRLHNSMRNRRGAKIERVVKINPSGLVIHQFMIALHRCAEYEESLAGKRDRARTCLGLVSDNPFTRSWLAQTGSTTVIKLPHPEFSLIAQPGGKIGVAERPSFITAISLDDRMLLWSGYHRTYAVLSQINPEGTGSPDILAAVIIPADDAERFLGKDSPRPEVRDLIRSDRPPIFSDFFNDALCMRVNLRKQRPEFHVDNYDIRTARMVWVDDE